MADDDDLGWQIFPLFCLSLRTIRSLTCQKKTGKKTKRKRKDYKIPLASTVNLGSTLFYLFGIDFAPPLNRSYCLNATSRHQTGDSFFFSFFLKIITIGLLSIRVGFDICETDRAQKRVRVSKMREFVLFHNLIGNYVSLTKPWVFSFYFLGNRITNKPTGLKNNNNFMSTIKVGKIKRSKVSSKIK